MAIRDLLDEAIEELSPFPHFSGAAEFPQLAAESELSFDELMAARQEPSLEDALRHYLDHPVDWVEDIIGVIPDDWQKEALNALANGRFVSIRSGRGCGKSCLQSWSILWHLCTHPFSKVIVTAPTKEQLYDVLWAECFKWIRLSQKLQQIVEWTQEKIYVRSNPAEWFAVARTADVRKLGKTGLVAAEGLQGRHAEAILIVLDEASGIDEAIMATIDGALTSRDSSILMASNPTRPTGTFFDSFHEKAHMWRTFHINSEDCPRRVDPGYCTRMRELYGSRDHPLYLIYVRGEFPPSQHNSLYDLAVCKASQRLALDPTPYDPYELGVDVARYGTDHTAIAVKHGPVIETVDKYFHEDTMQTAGRVMQYINKFRPVSVKIDVVGLGAGVYDRLRELGYRECMAVVASASPQSSDGERQFINLRAEAHWHLRMLLEQRRLRLPDDEELIGQMTSITYKITSVRGKIQIESKEEMRDRGARSPDKLDAVVLACQPVTAIAPARRAHFGTLAFMGR